jgi:hypothetical protein
MENKKSGTSALTDLMQATGLVNPHLGAVEAARHVFHNHSTLKGQNKHIKPTN